MNFGDVRLPVDFWDRCTPEPNSGCWLWIGSMIQSTGRPVFTGRKLLAYRVAVQAILAVPDGLVCDHLCNTPSCVNPGHIKVTTQTENAQRGNARRDYGTACKNGHPFDPKRAGARQRVCRECANESNRAYKARKKAESNAIGPTF